jgi:cobalamin biosynthesis protein CbiG
MNLQIMVAAGDAAASSRQAQALQRIILEREPTAGVERIRTDHETLDGGATLAVVLASPLLLELARCLRLFLQRYNSSQISITDEHGSIVAKNVSATTVDRLTREWSDRRDAS